MTAPALDAVDVLRHADEMLEQGRVREAIDALTAANRSERSTRIEQRLVEIRHGGFDELPQSVVKQPARVTASADGASLPEYRPEDLDLATLRQGLAVNGCVLVRGLIDPAEAASLAAGIDAAIDGFDRFETDDPADPAWHTPFVPKPGAYRVGGRRTWVRATGAVWTVDSPRMLFELTELLERTGIRDLVTSYFGERPALSANKCTLRRVPLTAMAGWHQDGSFLGEQVRSLNLWLALTDGAGVEAPGMDIVPRRIDRIVETGTEGAIFDWSVSPSVVEQESADAPVLRPTFNAGDALLFDHLLLHSTAVTEEMSRERYAMETWLFAPSAYPEGQIPLVL